MFRPSAYQHAYDGCDQLEKISSRTWPCAGTCQPVWSVFRLGHRDQKPPSVSLKPEPPGDPQAAWGQQQLHDELEHRANISLDEIQQQIERLSHELLGVTAQLVEKLTWVSLIRQTTHEQKQALGAYAAMRKKLARNPARVCATRSFSPPPGAKWSWPGRRAFPVWIMPLNEVADAFDPRTAQFDVVIIDEANQCEPHGDVRALPWPLQTVVVGDDEQIHAGGGGHGPGAGRKT